MRNVISALAIVAFAVLINISSNGAAQAAGVGPNAGAGALAGDSLVHRVQRCVIAEVACRDRYGGGPDYRRCMRRRDCGYRGGGRRRCNAVEYRCRENYGRGRDFRRCMRRRDCL